MRNVRRTLTAAAALLVGITLAWPGAASAQDSSFQVDLQGGVATPLGSAQATWERGLHARAAVTYWFDESLGVRVDGSRDALSGVDAAEVSGPFNVPNLTLVQTTGGFTWRAIDPADTSWLLNFDVAGGAAFLTSQDFPADVEQPADAPEPGFEITDFSERYLAVTAGAKLGYRFTPRVSGYLGSRLNYVATDRNDFQEFANFNPDDPAPFNPLWTLPLHLGVAVSF